MTITLASAAIGKSVATTVAKKFGGTVIERWTRHRAEHFFEGFAETVAIELTTGVQSDDVDKRLEEILADGTKSEVLFDAYRRVCFSKSKTLGPRMIGLLTGELVHEGRMADCIEQRVFETAELLSDGDFIEFMKSYRKHHKKAEGVTDRNAEHCMLGDSIIIRWLEEVSDSFRSKDLDIGAFPWEEAFGRWAVTLKATGLMEERMRQKSQLLDRQEQGQIIETRVTTTVTFCSGCAKLHELLLRSLGPEATAADEYAE